MDSYAEVISSRDTYVKGIPHETFRELRATRPVAWTTEPDDRGFWSLTKCEDVLYASRHTELFSSRMEGMDGEETDARCTLMEMDSPEHTRLRRLVSRLFTPRAVHSYENAVRDLAREVLDNLHGSTRFDFVKTLQGQKLIRRIPHSEDRRRVSIGLTAKGHRLIAELFPSFNQHERAAVSTLTLDEQRELARLLRKVTYAVTDEPSND